MANPSVSIILPVLISHPWQRHLTEAAIKILRDTTQVPFELVVVETESRDFHPDTWKPAAMLPTLLSAISADYEYLHRPDRSTLAKDINAGLDAATGDFVGW